MRPLVLLAAPIAALAALSCGRALEPSNRPVDACVAQCTERARRQCSEGECVRGCELILDRLVENEADGVLACVARGARRCTDPVWADCAARVGVHADGGPPPPLPASDDE